MNNKALNYSSSNTISLSTLCVNIFMFAGLGCFTLSLFLPAFFTSAEDITGYWILFTGWFGVIFVQFAWFANPVILLALLLAREHPRIAVLLSLLALLLALGAFELDEIPVGIHQEKVFIKEFGIGLYIWFVAQICFFLALLSNLINFYKRR